MKPRILVIRGGAIGDFILTLPALRLLRENFPAAHLEILGYRHIAAVADGRFYADAVRSIEYAELSRFFIPQIERDAGLASYFRSFQQVISYLYDPDQIFENCLRESGVKNLLCASGKLDDSDHAVQQLARPLEKLALFLDDPAPQLFPSSEDDAAATELLRAAAGPIFALHPGSGSERKNWPLEKWRTAVQWLLEHEPSAALLLIGGEADEERLQFLAAAIPFGRLITAWKLPLPVLAAVIRKCRLFLGHDSGITHLAAATGTPVIALFGPTDLAIWGPRNPNVTIVEAPENDLAQLAPAIVIAAMRRIAPAEN